MGKLAIAVGLVVTIAAGCRTSPARTELARAATARPPTATEVVAVDDAAVAQAVVLKLSDLGETWATVPTAPSAKAAGAAELYPCLGASVDDLNANRSASVDSDTFSTNERSIHVQNTVVVGRSADAMGRAFDLLEGRNTPACLDQLLRTKFAAATGGAQLGAVVTEVLDAEVVGDRTYAVRTTITLTQDSITLDLYADSIFVLQGRVTSSFFFLSLPSPLDPAFEHQVVRIVTDRGAALPTQAGA